MIESKRYAGGGGRAKWLPISEPLMVAMWIDRIRGAEINIKCSMAARNGQTSAKFWENYNKDKDSFQNLNFHTAYVPISNRPLLTFVLYITE